MNNKRRNIVKRRRKIRTFLIALFGAIVGACGSGVAPLVAATFDRFEITARGSVLGFPVPSFRPIEPGKVIGVDAFPSAGAVEHPDNGFAWFDACDADIMNNNNPVVCARMGIKGDRVEFGSRNFNGAPSKDVYIIVDRTVVARFAKDGLHVNGKVFTDGVQIPQ